VGRAISSVHGGVEIHPTTTTIQIKDEIEIETIQHSNKTKRERGGGR